MAMWNADQIVDRRIGGDLQGFAEAAAPIDVGLKNIERVLLDEPLEPPARVFVLAAGLRYSGLGLQFGIAVDAIGHEAFLDPARAELLDARAQIDGVIEVEALPAIDHQLIIVADGFAQRAHQGDVLVQALAAGRRPVADEPFLRGVAPLLIGPRPFAHLAESSTE